jgi:hypothetical protein
MLSCIIPPELPGGTPIYGYAGIVELCSPHTLPRGTKAMSNKRWRQASIIMIANSPRAGSWPYALHRVTPLGSEETSMPSVPASGSGGA